MKHERKKIGLWALVALVSILALPGAQALGPDLSAAGRFAEGAYEDISGEPWKGAQGNCNNYGIQVNTYVFAAPDCSSHENVQYCDQGSGAGAGAGAGGPGENGADAEATAGTHCNQNNGDDDDPPEDPPALFALQP